MIGAILGLLMVANLVGEIMPTGRWALPFHGDTLSVFQPLSSRRDDNGDVSTSMMASRFSNSFVCNAENKEYATTVYVDRFIVIRNAEEGAVPLRLQDLFRFFRFLRVFGIDSDCVNSVRFIRKDYVVPRVWIEECPDGIINVASANISKNVRHWRNLNLEDLDDSCYSLYSDGRSMADILNIETRVHGERSPIIDKGGFLELRDYLEPRPLLIPHFSKLII